MLDLYSPNTIGWPLSSRTLRLCWTPSAVIREMLVTPNLFVAKTERDGFVMADRDGRGNATSEFFRALTIERVDCRDDQTWAAEGPCNQPD